MTAIGMWVLRQSGQLAYLCFVFFCGDEASAGLMASISAEAQSVYAQRIFPYGEEVRVSR